MNDEFTENNENIPAEEEVINDETCGNEEEGEDGSESRGESDELLVYKDKMLRLAAEYDNYRKRTQREKETMFGNVQADTIGKFLPILDDLDRASAAQTQDESYAQGIRMIVRKFNELLEKLGVTEIEALGKPFDSNLHDAVMHEESEEAGENEVTEVFQKGYIQGDRVIRHSVVKVAN